MPKYPSSVNAEHGHQLTVNPSGSENLWFYSDFGAAASLTKEQVEHLRDYLNEWLDSD